MSNYPNQIYIILFVHIATIVSIGFDVPILRQVIGFIYLTFIPGFVILRILKLKRGNTLDTILFSVGLSIAFLMFTGLFMNELFPLFGVSKPLSTIPLLCTLISLTLILFFAGFRQDLARMYSNSVLESSARGVSWQALFLFFLPLLSIVGALYVNTAVLLLMTVLIAVLYALSVFSSRIVSDKYYPLIIFAISISLLFHASLISKYLMGWDIHAEYHVFKLTETQGYWLAPGVVSNPSQMTNFNSVTSITILPTIYSLLLNLEGELIFKLIFPFIFCLVPLTLYRIYAQQTGKMVALVSTFFFISSYYAFYGPQIMSLARQMIAELFLVLSVFLLVDKNMAPRNRQILFILFGAALVVSHYSIVFVYLFYIVFTFAFLYKKGNAKKLNLVLVLFLVTITFLWYIYISNSPFIKLYDNAKRMVGWFTTDLFSVEARSSVVFTHFALSTASSIVGLIHKTLYYVELFFIALGVLKLILKPKEMRFDPIFRSLSISSMFLLFSCVVIPNLAPTLNLTRFYMITLLFLAPFFVLGGKTVFSWLEKEAMFLLPKSRRRSYRNLGLHLVTIVLIASFLFQVGFVNNVTGAWPYGYTLDLSRKKTSQDLGVRISLYNPYIPEQDVFSARWLSKNIEETSWVYADRTSKYHVLTSYALIDRDRMYVLYNTTTLEHGGYIYLGYVNVREGVIPMYEGLLNITEISYLLNNETNKIYSNGDSEIYLTP